MIALDIECGFQRDSPFYPFSQNINKCALTDEGEL